MPTPRWRASPRRMPQALLPVTQALAVLASAQGRSLRDLPSALNALESLGVMVRRSPQPTHCAYQGADGGWRPLHMAATDPALATQIVRRLLPAAVITSHDDMDGLEVGITAPTGAGYASAPDHDQARALIAAALDLLSPTQAAKAA